MAIPVGLNVWSRLVEETLPYLDQTAGPFDSLWFPDHFQYGHHKVVAQHADWWNLPFKGREDYARKQEALKNHCREVGRDYDAIQQVLRVGILIAESRGEIERIRAQPDVRPIDPDCLVGTPPQLTETLLGVLEDGADRLTVHFSDAPRPEGTKLFAATVLPHLFRA